MRKRSGLEKIGKTLSDAVSGGITRIKLLIKSIDRSSSNLDSGDLISFDYTYTNKKKIVVTQNYTVLLVNNRRSGNDPLFTSTRGNTLISAYKIEHLQPETLISVLSSIYKGKEKGVSREQVQQAFKMIIGPAVLSNKNYRTFDDSKRGKISKISVENIEDIKNEITDEEEVDQ